MTARTCSFALAAWSCTILSGCADATPASLGTRDEMLDLRECFAADCEDGRAAASRHELPALEPTRVKECVPTEAPPVQIAWIRRLRDRPCAPLGFCSPNVAKFAPDGSLWTASATGTPLEGGSSERAGVFLAHYSKDNALLAETVIDSWTLPHVNFPAPGQLGDGARIEIAPDRSDHVFVTLTWFELDAQSKLTGPSYSAWIAEYDATAKLIGERKSVTSIPPSLLSLATGAHGDLFYLANDGAVATVNDLWGESSAPLQGKAVLAKLGAGLQLEWIQANPPSSSGALLGTDAGAAVVLQTSQSQIGTVSWWGNGGAAEAELVLPSNSDIVSLVPDGVLLRDKSVQGSVTYREVSRRGEERWATRVMVAPVVPEVGPVEITEDYAYLTSSAEALAPDGSVVRVATFEPPDRPSFAAIFRLDPSHETCNFSRLVDGPNGSFWDTALHPIFIDREGAISFRAMSPLIPDPDQVEQSFGRIESL
jgi:hypothetical protein